MGSAGEKIKAAFGMAELDPSMVGLSPFMVPIGNVVDAQPASDKLIIVTFRGGTYGAWESWESGFVTMYKVGDRYINPRRSRHSPHRRVGAR